MKKILFFIATLLAFSYALANDNKINGIVVSSNIQTVSANGISWEYSVTSVVPNGSNVKQGDLIALLTEKEADWTKNMLNHFNTQKKDIENDIITIETSILELTQSVERQKERIKIFELNKSSDNVNQSRIEQKTGVLDLQIENLTLNGLEESLTLRQKELKQKQIYLKGFEETSKQWIDRWTINPKDGEFYANFDGIVSYDVPSLKVGSLVYNGNPIVSVIDNQNAHIQLFLPETSRNLLQENSTVKIHKQNNDSQSIQGVVKTISIDVRKASNWSRNVSSNAPYRNLRSFSVLVELENTPEWLKHKDEIIAIPLQSKEN